LNARLKARIAGVRSNAAWASVDIAGSVWRQRDALSDPLRRGEALKDVGWDTAESVIKTAASSGGVAAAGFGLAAAAEGTGVIATAIAGSTVAAAAAPVLAGMVAAYGVGKLVTVARKRMR
jgi:hypothetical protein